MRRIACRPELLWPENYTVMLVALKADAAASTYPIRIAPGNRHRRAHRRRHRPLRPAGWRQGGRARGRLR